MPTNTGGGTTTSFFNTPQAKDDYYTASEDCVYYFDVMADDLGGNAKVLWSIDDNDLYGTTTRSADGTTTTTTNVDSVIDLTVKDVAGAIEKSALGASISIVDGKVKYDARALDWLADGQTATDYFTYAIRLSNGTLSWATVKITLTGSNDLPTVVSATATGDVTEKPEPGEGGTLTDTGTITFADVDLTDTHSATVSATVKDENGNTVASPLGTLTLGGVDQTANTVGWFFSVNDSALDFLADGETRTQVYTIVINDGHAGGNVSQTVTMTITGTNDQAVIGVADLLGAVTEGNGAPAALTDTGTIAFSDVDLTDTHSASAAFTSTTGAGQLGTLSASVSTDTTGSGTGGVVTWNYSVNDAAVQFLGVGDSITETYTVTLTDGETGGIVTRDVVVTITGTNDQAVVTTNGSLSYNENQAPTAINPALTISDVDSSTLTGATVSITGNFASGQDVLAFTNQNGISGSYNATTGVLTLTGAATVAQYQAALESITYFNSSDNPSGATRTVSFQVNDGAAANNLSNVATATVIVTPVNDAPVIDVDGDGASTFTTGGPTIVIDSSIPITDADSTQLQGATVQITAGLQSGDILNFTNQNGITGSYNGATGLLTLSGAAL